MRRFEGVHRRRWRFAAVLVLLMVTTAAWAASEGEEAPDGPIVVQNAYFPKPGLEEDVYRLRLRASAVRRDLGLVEGRVLRRVEGTEGGPEVIWEAEYPSVEARRRDVEALSGSAEFDEILERMGTLLESFERHVWRVSEPSVAPE